MSPSAKSPTAIRLCAATAAAIVAAVIAHPASAAAATNSTTTSIPVDPATTIEMHVTANCALAQNTCTFDTQANLLTPDGPTGLPNDAWARQTITLRSMNRDVSQQVLFSAPSGYPAVDKGANNGNVLSKQYKSINNAQISVTYFGGGPLERFHVNGSSAPVDWKSGLPATGADFIACSDIQVVYAGVNLSAPTACAQTTFS